MAAAQLSNACHLARCVPLQGKNDIEDVRTSSGTLLLPLQPARWVAGALQGLKEAALSAEHPRPKAGQTMQHCPWPLCCPSHNTGMFFRRGEDAVISNIEERIARWTLLPVGNGEGLQVRRAGWPPALRLFAARLPVKPCTPLAAVSP